MNRSLTYLFMLLNVCITRVCNNGKFNKRPGEKSALRECKTSLFDVLKWTLSNFLVEIDLICGTMSFDDHYSTIQVWCMACTNIYLYKSSFLDSNKNRLYTVSKCLRRSVCKLLRFLYIWVIGKCKFPLDETLKRFLIPCLTQSIKKHVCIINNKMIRHFRY